MKRVTLPITITFSILFMFHASPSHSNPTLLKKEEASFFELGENETNKEMNLKNKRELSKLQSTLINVLKPVPVVDTIQPQEKYGNKGDKFDRIGRGVVNGVEAIANVVSSALNFPMEAAKKLSRSATEALNNLGGKLVGTSSLILRFGCCLLEPSKNIGIERVPVLYPYFKNIDYNDQSCSLSVVYNHNISMTSIFNFDYKTQIKNHDYKPPFRQNKIIPNT